MDSLTKKIIHLSFWRSRKNSIRNNLTRRRTHMIHPYKNIDPKIHPSTFVAKNATVIGDVTIDEDCSIWFQSVLRGDVAPTIIGKRVNIQDLSMIHQSPDLPVTIED